MALPAPYYERGGITIYFQQRPVCPPHHWLIAPPDGPTSIGACIRCGERREFANSVQDHVPRVHRRAKVRPYEVVGLKYAAQSWNGYHVEVNE